MSAESQSEVKVFEVSKSSLQSKFFDGNFKIISDYSAAETLSQTQIHDLAQQAGQKNIEDRVQGHQRDNSVFEMFSEIMKHMQDKQPV